MKKLILLLAILGWATVGSALTIFNNTSCTVRFQVVCLSGTPCLGTPTGFIISIPPGSTKTYALCPGGLAFTSLHFWYDHCNANDPFVAAPGNCQGAPSSAVLQPNCADCVQANITYLGNGNWQIN
jgi:hypothetical protein